MEQSPNHHCILLVDDHHDTLTLQAILLRRNGYKVVTAKNAESALQAAAENDVDLVVSDLHLPDRSGVALMQDLHERHGLYGVALTGAADESRTAQDESCFVDVLIKPIAPDQIVQAIETAFTYIDRLPQ